MIGRVFKAYGGKYVVKENDRTYNLGARGVLKSKGLLVGDIVEFDGEVITKVFERKNRLIRPNVANIDCVCVVISTLPQPDFYLVDKAIINAKHIGVPVVLAVNKSDMGNQLFERVARDYQNANVDILQVSAKNKTGLEQLKQKLKGKLTVLAGQSAAGKTSLVNSIFGLSLKTGELSDKVERGKHTTTVSEIFIRDEIMIVDSPGFAVVDALVDKEDLPDCYDEYVSVAMECRFRGCSHINEPDCKVKNLVENGVLSQDRYNRYKEIYNEISKGRKKYEQN